MVAQLGQFHRLFDMEDYMDSEDNLLSDCLLRVRELETEIAVLKSIVDNHARYTKEAVDKAESTVNLRLESMNEFRGQLEKQASTFITGEIFNAKIKGLEDKLRTIELMISKQEGMASQKSVTRALIISGIGVLIGVLSFMLTITRYISGVLYGLN